MIESLRSCFEKARRNPGTANSRWIYPVSRRFQGVTSIAEARARREPAPDPDGFVWCPVHNLLAFLDEQPDVAPLPAIFDLFRREMYARLAFIPPMVLQAKERPALARQLGQIVSRGLVLPDFDYQDQGLCDRYNQYVAGMQWDNEEPVSIGSFAVIDWKGALLGKAFNNLPASIARELGGYKREAYAQLSEAFHKVFQAGDADIYLELFARGHLKWAGFEETECGLGGTGRIRPDLFLGLREGIVIKLIERICEDNPEQDPLEILLRLSR